MTGRRLRQGYTTGSCAAAASQGAARLLFKNEPVRQASLLTPKGIMLEIGIERRKRGEGWASCCVKKFAGDDPDVTDGICVWATVSLGADLLPAVFEPSGLLASSGEGAGLPSSSGGTYGLMSSVCGALDDWPQADGKLLAKGCGEAFGERWYVEDVGDGLILYLRGGEGIGRVTREGLSCPVGMWAINPVPRRMIFKEVADVCRAAGVKTPVWIVLEIPGGRELAQKTFNPRLGIVGGLSVLGSSGIVEPMSEPALLETIRLEIGQRALAHEPCLLLIPGNYGERFLSEKLLLPVERAVKCSNFIGKALDMVSDAGIGKVLLVGHAGKLVKLAAGVMNTHSKVADGRMECLAAYGAACGASREMARQILNAVTVDEALGILEQKDGCREETMEFIMQKISAVLRQRAGGHFQAEAILFTEERGILGMTHGAEGLLRGIAGKE